MRTGRILICGGRGFSNAIGMAKFLEVLLGGETISCVIHGGATGADKLAGIWARRRSIPVQIYPADWIRHGRRAGPLRNQQMIDDGKPDLVVAFTGGAGTADMVRRAKKAGVTVVEADIKP